MWGDVRGEDVQDMKSAKEDARVGPNVRKSINDVATFPGLLRRHRGVVQYARSLAACREISYPCVRDFVANTSGRSNMPHDQINKR